MWCKVVREEVGGGGGSRRLLWCTCTRLPSPAPPTLTCVRSRYQSPTSLLPLHVCCLHTVEIGRVCVERQVRKRAKSSAAPLRRCTAADGARATGTGNHPDSGPSHRTPQVLSYQFRCHTCPEARPYLGARICLIWMRFSGGRNCVLRVLYRFIANED